MGLRVKQTAVQNVVGTGASTGILGDVQLSDGAGGFLGTTDLYYLGGALAIGAASGSVLQIFNVLGNPLQLEPNPLQPAPLILRFPQGYPAGNGYLVTAGTTGLLGYTNPATFATPAQVAAAVAAAVAAQAAINTTLTNAAAAAQTTANQGVADAATALAAGNQGIADAANAAGAAAAAAGAAAAAQTTANQGVTDAASANAAAGAAQTTASAALPASGLGAALDALGGVTQTGSVATGSLINTAGTANYSHGLATTFTAATTI